MAQTSEQKGMSVTTGVLLVLAFFIGRTIWAIITKNAI